MDKKLKTEIVNHLYTTRWAINNNERALSLSQVTAAIDLLNGKDLTVGIDPAKPDSESTIIKTHFGNLDIPVVSKKGELWYPKAVKRPDLRMKARGTHKGGYPLSILIHFTAGRSGGLQKAIDSIKDGISNGFLYSCIADSGEFVQSNPLNEWGYHAGESAWPHSKLFSGSVSDECHGVEMNNAGLLTLTGGKFKTWFGTFIDEKDVRHVTEAKHNCPTGYYHKYTPEQEKTLTEFIVWAIKNDPTGRMNFATILGHHEVSGKLGIGRWRKNDPGGALSLKMNDYRDVIKELTK